MLNNNFWKLLLFAQAMLTCLRAGLASEAAVDLKVVEPASFCHFNPAQDLETKYCGLWGEIKVPEYPNNIEQVSLKTSLYYTSIVDLSLSETYADPATEVALQFSFANEDKGANFLPQFTNITSGDLAAMRYYYEAKCTESESKQTNSWLWRKEFAQAESNGECSKVEVEGIRISKGFSNKFIVMIADSRLATIAPGFIAKPSLDYFRQKPLTVNLRVLKKQN